MEHCEACIANNRSRQPNLRRVLFFAATILAVLTLPGAARADAGGYRPPGKRLLLLVGSNTLGETAMPELAKAYLEQVKKARSATIERQEETIYVTGVPPDGSPVYVEIHAVGSGDCFKSFLGLYPDADAACDIGMSSRAVTPEEADAIKEKTGSDLRQRGNAPGQGCEHPLAMDGVAIVVPASNPITRIGFSELQAIYSRKIVDWNQVADWKFSGGPAGGLPIVPVRRKEPSGTLDFFKAKIAPDPGPMSDETVIAAFTSSGELVKKVAQTPGGIGFVGQSYALLPGLKRLQVYDDSKGMMMSADEAVFPDNDAVRSEYYPLSRVLYLYTPSFSVNADVQPFLEFALGDQGQDVIAGKGGLIKIIGTQYEVIAQLDADSNPDAAANAGGGHKEDIILRLHGSNTVGAECAVNLAINYFMMKRQEANSSAPIEDKTTPLETPEGEKALAHEVKCDLDGDGTPQTIEIRPTGSSDAFRDLHQGLCDIGMASRPITEAERNYLMPICGNLSLSDAQFVLGLDALAILVSNENKVDTITLNQLRRVFVGDVGNWTELGGDDKPIHLHSRPDRSGTYKYFCDSVLLGRSVPDSAVRHPENSQEAEAVAKDPGCIGFVPMSANGTSQGAEGRPGRFPQLHAAQREDGAIRRISPRTVPLCLSLRARGRASQLHRRGSRKLGAGARVCRNDPELERPGHRRGERIYHRDQQYGRGRQGAARARRADRAIHPASDKTRTSGAWEERRAETETHERYDLPADSVRLRRMDPDARVQERHRPAVGLVAQNISCSGKERLGCRRLDRFGGQR